MDKINTTAIPSDIKLGLSQIASNNFTLILLGDRELGVNQVSIIAASLLLQGVINGVWMEGNEAALKQKEDKKEKIN